MTYANRLAAAAVVVLGTVSMAGASPASDPRPKDGSFGKIVTLKVIKKSAAPRRVIKRRKAHPRRFIFLNRSSRRVHPHAFSRRK